MTSIYKTELGEILNTDSLDVLRDVDSGSVDLIVTSPPYALLSPKEYGNVDQDEYISWFNDFAIQFFRVLKNSGSFVLNIGGSWNKHEPTKNLYIYKLLIHLCDNIGFKLAQDFVWVNPSAMPSPAPWVTIRRIRVKNSVEYVWWLSKTEWPKASNKRVLVPYSEGMKHLQKVGYTGKKASPAGYNASTWFNIEHSGSIPGNVIYSGNTVSNDKYLRYCKENDLPQHPARFPKEVPEYFIRMLTNEGDHVIDPFAGSCITGAVCERIKRKWTCIELDEQYCLGALGRFPPDPVPESNMIYKVHKPGYMWTDGDWDYIPDHGGKDYERTADDVPYVDNGLESVEYEHDEDTGHVNGIHDNELFEV